MFSPDTKGFFRGIIALLLLTLLSGCGFLGGNPPGSGGGGGGALAFTPTLVNLADAAPDRVVALSLKITDITVHQTSGANLSVLSAAGGLTVEMTHRQALFQPINLAM